MTYDVIIIGGGPAGIAAGIYADRQQLNALLITKGFGGQIAHTAVEIENYPGFQKILGSKLIEKLKQHLKKHRIDILIDSVVSATKENSLFLLKTENKKTFQAKAIIVASGADPRPLEVPGEKKFIGKGVSYCTLCDAPVFQEKDVAVIGGGDAGLEAALALSLWAKRVYVLEFLDHLAANPQNQQSLAQNPKIKIIFSAALQEIQGDQFVRSLVYKNIKTGEIKILPIEGIFVQIGSQPAISFVKSLVDFNEKDEIIIDPATTKTKTPGLFAAGDVTNTPHKQVVIAAGEGAKAALAVYRYLKKQKLLP